jgi:hypothetical protein
MIARGGWVSLAISGAWECDPRMGCATPHSEASGFASQTRPRGLGAAKRIRRIRLLAGEERDGRQHCRVHRGKEPTGGPVDLDRLFGILPVRAIHEQALEHRHCQQTE